MSILFHTGDDDEKPLVIRLETGESVSGQVRDPSGKPIVGVEVDDGSGKVTTTDANGRFTLRGLRKWPENI